MMLRPTIRSDPTICDDLRSCATQRFELCQLIDLGADIFEVRRRDRADSAQARRSGEGLSAINATIRADNTGGLGFCRRIRFVDDSIRRAVPLKNGVPSIRSTGAMFCD